MTLLMAPDAISSNPSSWFQMNILPKCDQKDAEKRIPNLEGKRLVYFINPVRDMKDQNMKCYGFARPFEMKSRDLPIFKA